MCYPLPLYVSLSEPICALTYSLIHSFNPIPSLLSFYLHPCDLGIRLICVVFIVRFVFHPVMLFKKMRCPSPLPISLVFVSSQTWVMKKIQFHSSSFLRLLVSLLCPAFRQAVKHHLLQYLYPIHISGVRVSAFTFNSPFER